MERACEVHPDNEVRIVEKFATAGGHENIVTVLRHGWLEHNRTYFFDMEQCILTLESFIRQDFRKMVGLERYFRLSRDQEAPAILNMWTIMVHITSGLNFVHRLSEIHRDLKPSNGFADISEANRSIALVEAVRLANCGLWSDRRGLIEDRTPYTIWPRIGWLSWPGIDEGTPNSVQAE